MPDKASYHLILALLLLVIFNVVILDIVSFSKGSPEKNTAVIVLPTPIPLPTTGETREPTVSLSNVPVSVPPAGLPQPVKEYYVPLGAGVTKNQAYEFLPAAEASVDTARYSGIKEIWFEVFFHIPTGNGTVLAKLFDVTDGHDVWFSEVSSIGDQVTKQVSKVTLETGNKLYRVMAKSSMGYEANIDQARLKIILN